MARDIAAEAREIDAAVEGLTVPRKFQQTVEHHSEVDALKWKVRDDWKAITWREYAERARDFANGMISLGLKPGEFVNIIAGNRVEYYVADIGTLHAGGTPVSLYNTLAPEQLSYIVNHCDAVYIMCENRGYFERLLKIRDELGDVRKVIMFDGADEFADDDWVISFDEVVEAGREYGAAHPDEFDKRWTVLKPEDLCTLIYTSGTTGPPKGVMVTHRNVLWTVESLTRMVSLGPGTTQISYLPLAHIAERLTSLYLPMYYASTTHFCPNPSDIGTYLADVRPEFFFAVPRVWEKIYERVNAAIANNPDPDQKKAAQDAIATRLEIVRLEQSGEDVPAELRSKEAEAEVVTSFIRSLVGLDRLTVVSSGAAPISKDVLEWYHAIGVPISEVYGQSEDTGPTSWNRPEDVRVGTVGPSIPGVEVKLLDDGELLVRGGNVTGGYYKEPDLTAETFDDDGWLHSGDVAEIDDDGFIKIVDRKKEILITAGGKNIAPSNVENLLKQHPLVGDACVIGDQKPFVSALIVLDPESASEWAKAKGKPDDVAQLASDPDVHREIQAHIDVIADRLHRQEQVKKFTVLPVTWPVGAEEVTPTGKMKRKVVNQKYVDEIEAMYTG